jgi:hypothetical protein
MPWTEMCLKLGVPESTCLSIWNKATKRVGHLPFGYDIHSLLESLHSKPKDTEKSGPNGLLKPSSKDASEIRKDILHHEDLPLHEAASIANILIHRDKTLARSAYEKVVRPP